MNRAIDEQSVNGAAPIEQDTQPNELGELKARNAQLERENLLLRTILDEINFAWRAHSAHMERIYPRQGG